MGPGEASVEEKRRHEAWWTQWGLPLAVAIPLMLLWTVTGWALFQSRQQIERQAIASVETATQALAIDAKGVFDKLKVGLSALSWEASRELAEGGIRPLVIGEYLQRQKTLLGDFEGLWVADERGDLRWGTEIPEGKPVNIADREYFQQLRDSGSATPVFSRPVIGRVTKTWSVLVAVRIERNDGSFAGAALGSLRVVDYFTARFASLPGKPWTAVEIRDEGQRLIVRSPAPADVDGAMGMQDLSPEVEQALAQDPAQGTTTIKASSRGPDTMVSYRRVADYPFWIHVAEATTAYLDSWWRDGAFALLFLVVITFICGLLVRGFQMKTKAELLAQRKASEMAALETEAQVRSSELEKHLVLENELRESQERLELAARSAQLGIWDWDIVNNRMYWDDQMFRLYGITERPATYGVEIWKQGLDEEDIERALSACEAALRGEANYDIVFRIRHSDGTSRSIKADGMVVRNDQGLAIRMLGINRDITETKRTEEELLKKQHLDALGLLAGGVAHDFNNLLAGIYAYIDLASQVSQQENVTKYLSKAKGSLDRARGLTLQLLTFAKGGTPLKKVGSLFPFVYETATFALSGSNVLCRCEVPENLPPCEFDRNQIGQVIDNLVINATQAMPQGGEVFLSASTVLLRRNELPPLDQGEYVVIAVQDTGVGIPKEVLPRIFDPFFTTKLSGHGLGLASCSSIVRRHGGALTVESTPGVGSTFRVYLPVCQPSLAQCLEAPTEQHRGRGVFLVMDDDEIMREAFREMLDLFGYRVECVSNADEALTVLRDQASKNELVTGMVFDLTIPGGRGGREVVAEARSLAPEAAIFVTSGYAEDPVMADPKGFGFTASIKKPFSLEELSQVLGRHIRS